MSTKKVLITGCAGFIGSNLASRFLAEGWDVTGVDDLSGSPGTAFVPHGVKLIIADFANDIMPEVINGGNFDVVAHLAAKPRVSYSVEHPGETTDINLLRTVKLMEACNGKIGRFINTSSSSVYGGAEMLPTPVWTAHNPQSPYAMQKSQAEQYAKLFHVLYGMDIVSIRPFNVFGPNQLGNSPYSCAVSAWLYATKHGKPLRSDGDGTQTRDITYVDNVVDVFVRCAKHPHKFVAGEAFNAGTGGRVSNNEVLEWFKSEYPDVEVQHMPRRPGDVMHTQADMGKAERVLGWNGIVSFWHGLEVTRRWAMSNPLF